MDPVMLERLRAVDLGTVLRDLGATRDQYDRHKFRLGGVLVNVSGQRFYLLREGRGGGGAIDLVMHVSGRDFREAVGYLGRYVGGEGTGAVVVQKMTLQKKEVFRLPEPCARCWVGVRGYLCGERALPEDLVDRVHQDGDVYADRRGNAVFVRRDRAGQGMGASLRGTRPGSTFKGLVAGSRRDAGYFSVELPGAVMTDGQTVLVLVESPIDALSYGLVQALRETPVCGRVVSTDGSGALPVELIGTALEHGRIVVCASDSDAAGDVFWERVGERYPDETQGEHVVIVRERPRAKDWNDDLRAAIRGGLDGGTHQQG